MRSLLAQPEDSRGLVGSTRLARAEPPVMEILAATVPDHEVEILDLLVDPSLKGTLEDYAPDLVWVPGYTTDAPRALSICREGKALTPSSAATVPPLPGRLFVRRHRSQSGCRRP